jgi:DNA-binding NarL/FixJ family response regulator
MRIVVVSDHALGCLGLVAALGHVPGARVVAEVPRLDEALQYCGKDEADAVLADARVITSETPDAHVSLSVSTHLTTTVATEGWTPWQVATGQILELSAREREVFFLLGKGLSNRHIGRRLGVTERTVKTHVGRVLAKLGVESRLQAGLTAFLHNTGS